MPNPVDLKGKVVVVTGASSGIGRTIGLEMGSRGARLVLAARRQALLQEVCEEVKRSGGEGYPVTVDLSTQEGCEALIKAAVDHFGGLDVLVNNAAVGVFGPLEETTVSVVRQVLATNLEGVIYTVRAAIPIFKRRGGGVIVNISSLAALVSPPWMAIYSATKAALKALTSSLRVELSPFGIRVVGVYPGYVDTPFAAASFLTPTARVARNVGASRPIGPVADPADVARALVKALERGENRDIYVGLYGRFSAFVAAHVPGVAYRFLHSRYRELLKRTSPVEGGGEEEEGG